MFGTGISGVEGIFLVFLTLPGVLGTPCFSGFLALPDVLGVFLTISGFNRSFFGFLTLPDPLKVASL
jgi:hypothetical protein